MQIPETHEMVKIAHVSFAKDAAGEWRWTLISSNGETTAHNEGHTTLSDARRAIRAVARVFGPRAIVDTTGTIWRPKEPPVPRAADPIEKPEP